MDIKEPFELFGVECGKGWNKLLSPIFDYITEYNKNKKDNEKIRILQVKEKFGGLRFYVNFETKELEELISTAEDESYKTCELCGSTEDVGHTLGWITTCCKKCAIKMAGKHDIEWRPNNIEKEYKYYLIDGNGAVSKIPIKEE